MNCLTALLYGVALASGQILLKVRIVYSAERNGLSPQMLAGSTATCVYSSHPLLGPGTSEGRTKARVPDDGVRFRISPNGESFILFAMVLLNRLVGTTFLIVDISGVAGI